MQQQNGDLLYVVNFGDGTIGIYERAPIAPVTSLSQIRALMTSSNTLTAARIRNAR